jgi:sarcosine oxidase subunit gamma
MSAHLENALEFEQRDGCERFGLKGPRAAEWLELRGIALPEAPNRWVAGAATGTGDAMLVARLGSSEFFLEDRAADSTVRGLEAALEPPQSGVYPVLREDAAFSLSGPGSCDVLAQVCNVNFADLELASHPVIMTLMIGVAVLVVPQMVGASPRFRIWCDPTFGPYLEESLGTVVTESGGNYRR